MAVTGGKGTMKADGKEIEVKEGYVFFVGYGTEIELNAERALSHTQPFARCKSYKRNDAT
jgi:mannose-6-phosphate isomerase